MHLPRRTELLAAALLFITAPSLGAQTPFDPSGHWEGTVQAPNKEIRIEVDFTKNGKGELAGTFTGPEENVRGLPFRQVTADNRLISFHARTDQTFKGTVSDDGKSMAGDFTIVTAGGTFTIPFNLIRTADARIEPLPKGAPITRDLEGTWKGTLNANGKQMRTVLTMVNHPDGTSTGSLVSVDEGGLEIPLVVIQKASSVSLDIRITGAAYSGNLNPEGTELVGTYTQGPLTLPLTFRRTPPEDRK